MNLSFIRNKTILIVDDEPELLKMVAHILKDDGFQNIITASGMQEAIENAKKFTPVLALLDINLPDGDSFELLKQLRYFTDIPAIFLTAKDETTDRLTGLRLGADDYIVMPFLPQELLLRIYNVLNRCYKEDNATIILLAGSSIDFSRAEVSKNGKTLSLTAKEYALLEVLAQNAGKIVTIDALCEAVWVDNPFGYENSLMAHIRRIREKIEDNPSSPVSLITVKGLGYKLLVERN